MKRLEGKVAVVTGGNSGIGLATARRFQLEGARVAISGRNKKTLDEAVKMIGNGVLAIQADVAKLADLDKLYTEISKKMGKIDVLFVNAGIAKNVPLAETPESVFEAVRHQHQGSLLRHSESPTVVERRGFHHLEHERCGQPRYAKR